MLAKELTVIGSVVAVIGFENWPGRYVGLVDNGRRPQPLLGWKIGDPRDIAIGWPAEDVIQAEPALRKAGMRYGWWLEMEESIKLISVPAIVLPAGESCELCHDFASFAVPNCVNGTKFVCFSCRQGWIPPHLR